MKHRQRLAITNMSTAPVACAAAIWSMTALGVSTSKAETSVRASPSTESSTAEPRGFLDDIVVTARKRSEVLSDIPVAASALDGGILEKVGVTDLFSTQYLVPGLLINKGNGSENSLTIRGASSDVLGVGVEPSSALHIDGVYVSRLTSLNAAFLDLDRVEVLRGPQGTLYGRNSIGGSVNLISKLPSNTPEFRFESELGGFGHTRLQGIASGPTGIEGLSSRLAIQQVSEDGYLNNIATGRPYGKVNHFSIRGSVLYDLSPTVQLVLRADLDRQRDDGVAQKGMGVGLDPHDRFDLRTLGAIEPTGTYDVANDLQNFANTDVVGFSAHLDWTLERVGFRSITGYRSDKSDALTDLDASSVNAANNRVITRGQQLSQEFQAFSRENSHFEWLGGVFLFRDQSKYDFRQELNTGHNSLFGAGFLGLGDLTGLTVPPAADPTTWSLISAERQNVKTDSVALFGNATYRFTEWFSLSGGARYNREHKSFIAEAASLLADPGLGPILVDFDVLPFTVTPTTIDSQRDHETYSASYNNFLPSLTASLTPAPGLLVYATYSQGFHSGGVNLRLDQTPLKDAAFNPEKAKNYELGLKAVAFGGRLRANLAVYQLDYTDRQVSAVFNDPKTGIIRNTTVNGVATRSRGLELELGAHVSEAVSLTTAFGYIKTLIVRDVRPVDPTNPDAGNHVVDVSGENQELDDVPKYTFSTIGSYRRALTNALALESNVAWTWRARTPVYNNVGGVPALDPNLAIPSYHLVNAEVKIGSPKADWAVGLYAENLLGKVYYYELFAGSFALRRGYVAPPRQVGLQLSKAF